MRPYARSSRGFSILELLIAMALGLLVLGAAMLSSAGMVVAGRQQRATREMTDDALLALSLIRRDLLMAGYVHPSAIAASRFAPADPVVHARAVFGCNHGFVNVRAAVGSASCAPAGSTSTSASAASSAARDDAIEINFEATSGNVDLSSDNRLTDCQGAKLEDPAAPGVLVPVATAETRYATSHRYFVNTPAKQTTPNLSCASAVSGAQALVPNVEALRITYGVASGWVAAQPASWRPVRYVDAGAVGSADWSNVVAVQVCVLMRSDAPVLDSKESQTHASYIDCEGASQQSTDLRLRRAYTTTVGLRNRVPW